jgi:hypothetical protein
MMLSRLQKLAIMPLALACGCSSLSHTENGALAGGGLGAVTGALIGSQTGHTAGGAAIGGAVGALAGGLVGNAQDQTERKIAAAEARSHIGVQDVIQMAQSHVSDEVIINHIRSSNSVVQLSAQDTIWLKQNGVSDRVVAEMQATSARVPRRYYAPPVYVVEPCPPPPPVGFGFAYTRYRR